MHSKKNQDKYFDKNWKSKDFEFDEKVVSVFDDMVSRSVPYYNETRTTALSLAKKFVQKKTNIYDIGCSTATLLIEFSKLVQNDDVNLIGLDNSKPMIAEAKKKISELGLSNKISLNYSDAEKEMSLKNASIVFMNYTLQFVRPFHRENLLNQIYNALNKNGCLILVEKILGNDSHFNRLYIDLYYEYKSKVGYSDEEIKNKRESLENILIPYRIDENIDLLKNSGFNTVDVFFKWFNWAGIVAVKS